MAERPVSPALTTPGKATDVCVALMRLGSTVYPITESFTVATGGAAKAATELTVAAAIANNLAAGQGLSFVDANDVQYFAVLAEDADAGATTFTVEPLGEAIPADAAAAFPVRSMLRTSANLSQSVETEEIDTFDHASSAFLQTSKSAEFTMDGMYSSFDPGAACVRAAIDQGLRLYIRTTFKAPSANYVSGARNEFFAIPSSAETAAPVDGSVT
ncbi:MAG: hypothetical protein AAGA67_07705 [Cyanobacteria bacterium P01_F01_bin.153]